MGLKELLMTIFNIDKTNDNRKEPRINQNDHVGTRMAHGTTQFHNKTESDTGTGSLSVLERKILAKQEGTNKAVFGFLDSSNRFGLKVAPDGIDVLTATDAELIFNSEQNIFKIANIVSGTIALSFPAQSSGSPGTFSVSSTNSLTLSHGLSIVPSLIPQLLDVGSGLYSSIANGSQAASPRMQTNGTGLVAFANYTLRINVDATNVYIDGLMSGGGGTSSGYSISGITYGDLTFKVFCLQETAAV